MKMYDIASFKYLQIFFFIVIGISIPGQSYGQNATYEIQAPTKAKTGESFRIQFSSGEPLDDFFLNNISFDRLEIVNGPTLSTSTSIQNLGGTRKVEKKYSYIFIAKSQLPGKFEVGPTKTKFKGKKITIHIYDQEEYPLQSEIFFENDLFIQPIVHPILPLLNEPVRVSYKLFSRVKITDLQEPAEPGFRNCRVLTLPTPAHDWWTELYDSRIYHTLLLKEYIIYPKRSGEVTIPSLEVIIGAEILKKEECDSEQSFEEEMLRSSIKQTIHTTISSAPLLIHVKKQKKVLKPHI